MLFCSKNVYKSFLSIILVSAIGLSACSQPNRNPDPRSSANGKREFTALTQLYPQIRTLVVDQYIQNICARLWPKRSKNESLPTIAVVNADLAFALSIQGGYIILSSELFRHVFSEHELAFIIAHEMAHLEFGTSEAGIFREELRADRRAQYVITRAGFNRLAAAHVFTNTLNVVHYNPARLLHPDKDSYPHPAIRLENLSLPAPQRMPQSVSRKFLQAKSQIINLATQS